MSDDRRDDTYRIDVNRERRRERTEPDDETRERVRRNLEKAGLPADLANLD